MISFEQFIQGNLSPEMMALFVAMLVWSLAWKGVALWKSARLYHKWWFIILLLANTVGLLEIVYIFFIARKAEREDGEEEKGGANEE